MTTRTLTNRYARPLVLSLLLATILALSGCGPVFSYLFCGDQQQTNMDCSTQEGE